MDIALCTHRLRPNAKWGTATTYLDLQRTWQDDVQTIPSEAELEAEWLIILSEIVLENNNETDRDAKRLALINAISTLRTWATNAETAVAAWDGQTTAQRFATLKIVIGRFGTLCSKMADLFEVRRLD